MAARQGPHEDWGARYRGPAAPTRRSAHPLRVSWRHLRPLGPHEVPVASGEPGVCMGAMGAEERRGWGFLTAGSTVTATEGGGMVGSDQSSEASFMPGASSGQLLLGQQWGEGGCRHWDCQVRPSSVSPFSSRSTGLSPEQRLPTVSRVSRASRQPEGQVLNPLP